MIIIKNLIVIIMVLFMKINNAYTIAVAEIKKPIIDTARSGLTVKEKIPSIAYFTRLLKLHFVVPIVRSTFS